MGASSVTGPGGRGGKRRDSALNGELDATPRLASHLSSPQPWLICQRKERRKGKRKAGEKETRETERREKKGKKRGKERP